MATLSDLHELQKIEYKLLKTPIHSLTMDQVLQKIDEMLQKKQKGYIVTADASTIITATYDAKFMKVVQDAAVVTPDGMGIVWAISKLYNKTISKVSGVELGEQLCELSAKKGYKIFLLGAQPGVGEIAARKLIEKYPGCQIIGSIHGFFEQKDNLNIAKKIASLNPDILLVALGMPRQEKFLSEYLSLTNATIGIGVGGAFDVYSQKTKRAPKWFQDKGLEWLWRFVLNPTKIKKVMMLPKFVWMVKKEYGKNLHKNR